LNCGLWKRPLLPSPHGNFCVEMKNKNDNSSTASMRNFDINSNYMMFAFCFFFSSIGEAFI